MAHDNETGSFGPLLGAFVLGATAGAAVALLFAPSSGRETRAHLKDVAIDLKQKLERAPEAIRAAGASAMKAGQAAYDQARGDGSRSAELS